MTCAFVSDGMVLLPSKLFLKKGVAYNVILLHGNYVAEYNARTIARGKTTKKKKQTQTEIRITCSSIM